jgi:HEAT repeats
MLEARNVGYQSTRYGPWLFVAVSMKGRLAAIALLSLLATESAPSQPASGDGVQIARAIVEQLRPLPTPLPTGIAPGLSPIGERPIIQIPASEVLRDELYRQLYDLGPAGVMALADGYGDADVHLRSNVALALSLLGGGYWQGLPKLDISLALPALTDALTDPEPSVRWWSAQAMGHIGTEAASAVPALILLLQDDDEGSRNSACIALRGIGSAANAALPALRRALSDPSADVRQFAQLAIDRIEL